MVKKKSLSYQDIYLVPKYSPVHSRSEIDVSVRFGPRTFNTPAIPANMKCCIDFVSARDLSANGHFYIMHRFGVETVRMVQVMNEAKWKTISISIGVQDTDKEILRQIALSEMVVDYITIDIAHAHSIRMKEMLEFIKGLDFKSQWSTHVSSNGDRSWTSVPLSYRPFVIAGNVATSKAVLDLGLWGADAVKVGIAQGGACTTYGKTGFGEPMFTCMMNCVLESKVPLIADGGIRTNGDFAKAIVAGGSMVMAGSLFAACIDSPAETLFDHDTPKIGRLDLLSMSTQDALAHIKIPKKKVYFGSASEKNKGNGHHVEGTTVYLDVDPMSYAQKFTEIKEDIQSACSYGGGSMESLSNSEWGIR